MLSVLVIDDHKLVATSLAMALEAEGVRAELADVRDEDTILAAAAERDGGLALLDLDLGSTVDGATLVAPLRALGWTVLVLTGSTRWERIAAAVAYGAVGWVSKSTDFRALVRIVLSASQGKPVCTPRERAELIARHREAQARHQAGAAQRAEAQGRLALLSARERQVLDRLADGLQASAIASEFVVSLATVRTQIRSLLAKLEVSSQLAAVALLHRARGE